MAELNEIKQKIIAWAQEKGIFDHSTTEKQMEKCRKEAGKLAIELIRGDKEKAKMEFGDFLVKLVLLEKMTGIECVSYGCRNFVKYEEWGLAVYEISKFKLMYEHAIYSPVLRAYSLNVLISSAPLIWDIGNMKYAYIEALTLAYEKISKRKGKMVDGMFVKEEYQCQ